MDKADFWEVDGWWGWDSAAGRVGGGEKGRRGEGVMGGEEKGGRERRGGERGRKERKREYRLAGKERKGRGVVEMGNACEETERVKESGEKRNEKEEYPDNQL